MYMNKYKNKQDDALTADWLRDNGIQEKQLQAGLPEILQAQLLATNTLSVGAD